MKRCWIALFVFGIFLTASGGSNVFAQERVKDAAQKLSDLCNLTKSDVVGLKYKEDLFTDATSPFQAYDAEGKALEVQPFEFQTLSAFDGAKGFLSIPEVVEGAEKSLSKEAFEKIVSLMRQLERLQEVGGPSIERIARIQQKDGSIRVGFLMTRPAGKIPSTILNANLKASAKSAEAVKLVDFLVTLTDANWLPLHFNPSSVIVDETAKEDAKTPKKLGSTLGVSPWNVRLIRKSELPDLTPPAEGKEKKPGNDIAAAKRVRDGLQASISTAQTLKGIMNQSGKLLRSMACGRAIASMQAAIDSMKIPEEKAKDKGGDGDLQVGMKRK